MARWGAKVNLPCTLTFGGGCTPTSLAGSSHPLGLRQSGCQLGVWRGVQPQLSCCQNLALTGFFVLSTLGSGESSQPSGIRQSGFQRGVWRGVRRCSLLLYFFTLVTGPRRSLSLKLSDTGNGAVSGECGGGRTPSSLADTSHPLGLSVHRNDNGPSERPHGPRVTLCVASLRQSGFRRGVWRGVRRCSLLLYFFTLVTGPKRSLSLKLSDTGNRAVSGECGGGCGAATA